MKLLFLDIDGVLNSKNSFLEKRGQVDSQCVSFLNKITDETDAKIVISSSWRFIYDFETLKDILKVKNNISGRIIGITPILDEYFSGENPIPRGIEIEEFLKKIRTSQDIESYVILDDMFEILYTQKKNFFHINDEVGLTEKDANKIIKFFKENDEKN